MYKEKAMRTKKGRESWKTAMKRRPANAEGGHGLADSRQERRLKKPRWRLRTQRSLLTRRRRRRRLKTGGARYF
jgi:hypothetical protein